MRKDSVIKSQGLKPLSKSLWLGEEVTHIFQVLVNPAAAAAAAKSLQSCPTLCEPIDGSLPGSSTPGIFQARVLEWGAIAFSTTCHKHG